MTLSRGYQPGTVIIDPGYSHNTSFLIKDRKSAFKVLRRIS